MGLIDIIYAIIYGIIEGITEWLPISSTGHLIILNRFIQFQSVNNDFFELFLVVIQLGAIIAVLLTFFNQLCPFGKKKTSEEKKQIYYLWKLIIIGCLPAGIIGFFFDDILDQYLYNDITVIVTLIVYGVLFILVEMLIKNKKLKINEVKDFTYKTALIIGFSQILSLIPGTSRSGVTILCALFLGCSRQSACQYSFYLSIPIMFMASLLKLFKYFIGGNVLAISEIMILLTGCIMAFVVSLFIVTFLLKYVKKHDFKIFGLYRIVLGIVLIVLLLLNS